MSRWMDGLVDELVSDQEFRGEVRIDVTIDLHALNPNQSPTVDVYPQHKTE